MWILRLLLGFPAHSVCPAELIICCTANQAMVCTGENFPGFLLHSASSKCSACAGIQWEGHKILGSSFRPLVFKSNIVSPKLPGNHHLFQKMLHIQKSVQEQISLCYTNANNNGGFQGKLLQYEWNNKIDLQTKEEREWLGIPLRWCSIANVVSSDSCNDIVWLPLRPTFNNLFNCLTRFNPNLWESRALQEMKVSTSLVWMEARKTGTFAFYKGKEDVVWAWQQMQTRQLGRTEVACRQSKSCPVPESCSGDVDRHEDGV